MAKRGRMEQSRKFRSFRTRVQEQQRRILALFAGVVAVVVLLLIAGVAWEMWVIPNRVVARVNGEDLYMRDFQARVRFRRALMIQQIGSYLIFYQQFQAAGLGLPLDPQIRAWIQLLDDPEALGEEVLNDFIDDTLIRQEMQRRGITVTEEEIERAIQEAFGFFPEGTPTPPPSPTPWATSTLSPTQLALLTPAVTPTPSPGPSPTAVPSPTPTVPPTPLPTLELVRTPLPTPSPTPYTEEQFRQDLQAFLQDTGISLAALKAIFRDGLYREKFLEELAKEVPREEEQVWVRHILVTDEEQGKELLERLQKGEPFDALARMYSQDRTSAANGGDLGWIARGQMVQPFEEVAFSLEIGEISGLVATPFGWHIIQVLGREVRPLPEEVYQQRLQERAEQWLEEARLEADIEVFDIWRNYVPNQPLLPPQFRLIAAAPTPALQPVTPVLPTPSPQP